MSLKSFLVILFPAVILLNISTPTNAAPLVRAGDATAHGTVLSGAGSPNVIIGGSPAWRANVDQHCCPLMVYPGLPHGCGYVQTGASNILINGSPAVFAGCSVTESGGIINQIIAGCPTVVYGP